MAVKTHSLWLIPDKRTKEYKRLSTKMRQLSERFGGPLVDPHVTLVGETYADRARVISTTSALAAKLKPYTITITGSDNSDFYFKSVFLRVSKTSEVLAANKLAQRLFGRQDPPYDPHLSLLYGTLDSKTREAVMQGLDEFDGLRFKVSGVSVFTFEDGPQWNFVKEIRFG